MKRKTFGLCACIFVWAISICAQSRIDERGTLHAREEQVATNKRLGELLRNPTFITLRLVSTPNYYNQLPSDTPAPYKVGEWISFQLFAIHSLSEPLVIVLANPYEDLRLELLKDNDPVSYKKEVLDRADSRGNWAGRVIEHQFLPGKEYGLESINLRDWYEPLGPGHYQLSVSRRFVWDGDWVQSNPVIFDVEPRKPPTPIPVGISVEMVPEDFQDKPKQKIYRLSGEVYVRVVVVNNSNREMPVTIVDLYYGNRPQLFKDGVLLPYLDEIVKLLSSKEENLQSVHVSLDLSLPPHTRSGLQGLSLTKWYGPLPPGHYRLVNRRRFEINGPWTADSAELLFEVVARAAKP